MGGQTALQIIQAIADTKLVVGNQITGDSLYDWNTLFQEFALHHESHVVLCYVDGVKKDNGKNSMSRTGAPTGAYPWGTLVQLYLNNGKHALGFTDFQIYLPDYNMSDGYFIYVRSGNPEGWQNWKRFAGQYVQAVQ